LNLAQVEANSELGVGNVARAQLVEVSEELTDSDSVLAASLSDAGAHILNILWGVANHLSLGNSWAGLWVVIEGVVVLLANTIELSSTINIFAEVNVVNFVNIAHVHVSAEQLLGHLLWSVDLQQIEHTEELNLGHVTVLGAVKVLELGLQVDATDLDGAAVLIKNLLDGLIVSVDGGLEVLSASQKSVVLCNGWHTYIGGLVDTLGGESLVDRLDKGNIVEELLWVTGLILGGQGVVFVLSKVEVELAQDSGELSLGHMALTQLVEVEEELLDTHTLHGHDVAETVLNISWIVADLNSVLEPSVVDHVQVSGLAGKEWRSLISSHAWNVVSVGWGVLGHVAWENVLWAVQVKAELPVVDFSGGASVAVLSNDQVKDGLVGWHEAELLEHAEELVLGDVELLASVEVHEAWFEEDTLGLDFVVHFSDGVQHGIFLIIRPDSLSLDVLNGGRWVHLVAEHHVELLQELSVVNHAGTIRDSVSVDELLDLGLGESNVEGANAGAESSLSTGALAELVEVNEELLHADAVLGGEGLQTTFNVGLGCEGWVACLEGAWVAVVAPAHVLALVAE